MSEQIEERLGRLSGRCCSGEERGAGTVVHIVSGIWRQGASLAGVALCGAEPGRRSAHCFVETDEPASCARCLRRLHARTNRILREHLRDLGIVRRRRQRGEVGFGTAGAALLALALAQLLWLLGRL